MPFYIRKAGGYTEEFDREKLKRSLMRPGASEAVADKIISGIESNLEQFPSTEDIYRYALDQLRDDHPYIATKFNIKKALLELGPTGYPFEKYIAKVFEALGYETQLNLIISGWCVDHEVDVVVTKDKKISMVECKYHNVQGLRTDVQVTMYTEARYQDISKTWKPSNLDEEIANLFLVTNTKFTYEALKYGNCKNQNLLSWDYPKGESLADIIDRFKLYPITASLSLSHRQKRILVNNDFILYKDALNNIPEIQELNRDIDIYKLEREFEKKY